MNAHWVTIDNIPSRKNSPQIVISSSRGVRLSYSGPLYKPQREYERIAIKPIDKLHENYFLDKNCSLCLSESRKRYKCNTYHCHDRTKFHITETIFVLKMKNISCKLNFRFLNDRTNIPLLKDMHSMNAKCFLLWKKLATLYIGKNKINNRL